jgi:hypothetical protein
MKKNRYNHLRYLMVYKQKKEVMLLKEFPAKVQESLIT